MKLFAITTMCVVVWNVSALAQRHKLQWDDPVQLDHKVDNQRAIGLDKTGFYFLSWADGKHFIQKFDATNHLAFDKEMNFSAFATNATDQFYVSSSLMLKDRFVMIVLSANKKNPENDKLLIVNVSLDGEVMNENKHVIPMNVELRGSFYLVASPDSNKVAVCTLTPKQKHVDKDYMTMNLYDNKLNELSHREINVTVEDFRKTVMKDVLLSNEGGLYMLTSQSTLWYVAPESNEIASAKLRNDENFNIRQSSLRWSGNGELILAGFYSDGHTRGHYFSGYFYWKVNRTDLSVRGKTGPIPMEAQGPPHSTDSYFPYYDVINTRNGNTILVLEYIWSKSNNIHLGNLLVTNVDSTGALVYSTLVKKNQSKLFGVFRSKEFLDYYSYYPIEDGITGDLTLFFNTNEDLEHPYLRNVDKSILAKVTIDNHGSQSTEKVAATQDTGIITYVLFRIRPGNELVVIGKKEEVLWLGRLQMN